MTDLDSGVARIAEATLADQQFVTPVDILIGLGWLLPDRLSPWLRGLVTSLDRCLRVGHAEAAKAIDALTDWALQRGLSPWDTNYAGLQFTTTGDPEAERRFRTRWAPDEHPAPTPPPPRSPQPKVLAAAHAWECHTCGRETSDLLLETKAGGICLACAGLGHLVFLPSGDAALTRRTVKTSRTTAVVLRMNTRRMRHERQGILTEQRAIELAAVQCLDDDRTPQRAKVDEALRSDIADNIRTQFPGCPPTRADAIAYFAAVRRRARRTRTKTDDPDAVRAAVTESVRRIDTDYDDLLLTGIDRTEAEQKVQGRVDDILNTWSSGATVLD